MLATRRGRGTGRDMHYRTTVRAKLGPDVLPGRQLMHAKIAELKAVVEGDMSPEELNRIVSDRMANRRGSSTAIILRDGKPGHQVVQYTDEQIANAVQDAYGQANPDSAEASGVAERYGDATNIRAFDGAQGSLTDMDALVAYLQMLGTLTDAAHTTETAEAE